MDYAVSALFLGAGRMASQLCFSPEFCCMTPLPSSATELIGVKWVIGADKDKLIQFCCVQSDAAEPYFRACGLDREDVIHRMLFVEGLNEYSQGSTAAFRVLSHLPPPYSALSSLWVIPAPLRDAVYDYAAKQRYEWLGRAEDYLVLREKELLERFIDREELMRRAQDL